MSLLIPKNTKFRYTKKGRNRGIATNCNTLAFGNFGIVANTRGSITSNQIESSRKVITHHFKRNIKLWIRIFPNSTRVKRAPEIRLGSGKSPLDFWYFNVKPGRIMFEFLTTNSVNDILDVVRKVSSKLPIKCSMVQKT